MRIDDACGGLPPRPGGLAFFRPFSASLSRRISRYAPHSFLENLQNIWQQNGILVNSESLTDFLTWEEPHEKFH